MHYGHRRGHVASQASIEQPFKTSIALLQHSSKNRPLFNIPAHSASNQPTGKGRREFDISLVALKIQKFFTLNSLSYDSEK